MKTLVVVGGVAANSRVRALTGRRCAAAGVELRVPPLTLCTDNGAMIAAVGDLLVRSGAEPAPPDVSVDPSAPLAYASLNPLRRATRASRLRRAQGLPAAVPRGRAGRCTSGPDLTASAVVGRQLRPDLARGRDEVLQRGTGLGPATGLQPAVGVDPEPLGGDRLESLAQQGSGLLGAGDARGVDVPDSGAGLPGVPV